MTQDSARVVALRLLGRRDYTAAELRQRLTDRGFAPDLVEATLADLREQGLQDDTRAAHAHVRTASRVKGRGPYRIRHELQARGVPADAIEASTASLTPEDVRETLERLLARKHLTLPLPDDERRRLFQRLLRRGFSAEAIAEVLKK
ncbi:MAG TPA: RecX family transcriptional regulator [Vicinamibacterales bacterium]|jgi:regulatory protein|nr:RecX family transcriptional regulator [Vicinamibacterales bacterium]